MASADNSTNSQNKLVQKIAEKFNLNQDEVQQVFNEVRKERQVEMQAKEEEKLTQLVTDGKITEEQKILIQAKQEELRTERKSNNDSFKNLTDEERKTQMETKKTELETWASENDIDMQYLMSFGKGHGGPGAPRNDGGYK